MSALLAASIAATVIASPQPHPQHDHDALVCGGCSDHAPYTQFLFRRPPIGYPAGVVYLNSNAGVSVALGETMDAEPFANRTTEGSLASVVDLDTPETADPHTQASHVWVSGGELELDFDLGNDFDLTTMHFWNYNGESYDVDEIDMIFFDSSMNEIGRIDDLAPALGVSSGGGIVAENIPLAFPSGTRHINMFLRGSNSQVDFQNIGFTGSFTAGGQPVEIAAGPASVLLPVGGGSVAFTVSAIGTPPLTYQWRKDGAPIDGADTSSLTIDATTADIGLYDCVVSNGFGSATTAAAVLGVRPSGCNAADVALPEGTLDIDDVLAFLAAFAAGCP